MDSGTARDWEYGVQGIFAFTFELGSGKYQGSSAIGPEVARNRGAVLYLIGLADCPYRVIGKASARCPACMSRAPKAVRRPSTPRRPTASGGGMLARPSRRLRRVIRRFALRSTRVFARRMRGIALRPIDLEFEEIRTSVVTGDVDRMIPSGR